MQDVFEFMNEKVEAQYQPYQPPIPEWLDSWQVSVPYPETTACALCRGRGYVAGTTCVCSE